MNEAFISGSGRMFMHLCRKYSRSVMCKRDVQGKVRVILRIKIDSKSIQNCTIRFKKSQVDLEIS